jgi:hypothetical protein
MIEISTYRVDLSHNGLGFGGRRIANRVVARWRENKKRKKVRTKKEEERVCPILRMSHTDRSGTTYA